MPLAKIDPTTTEAWKRLADHYGKTKNSHLKDLFDQDPGRAKRFSIRWSDFFLDFSKNRIDDTTLDLLLALAEEMELRASIDRYFSGDIINETEGRAVLHTALRAGKADKVLVDGENVIPGVYEVREHIRRFSERVISGKMKGYTGKAFTDVVNIGIGGSDLGPVMVTEALKFYNNPLRTHFVSNIDGDHVQEVLKQLDPETTLFIVVSKTFTTQETLTNALTIKEWFLKSAAPGDIALHFAAVSTNTEKIREFGISYQKGGDP